MGLLSNHFFIFSKSQSATALPLYIPVWYCQLQNVLWVSIVIICQLDLFTAHCNSLSLAVQVNSYIAHTSNSYLIIWIIMVLQDPGVRSGFCKQQSLFCLPIPIHSSHLQKTIRLARHALLLKLDALIFFIARTWNFFYLIDITVMSKYR